MSCNDILERIAQQILPGYDKPKMPDEFTLEELHNKIGTSRSTVERRLNELVKSGKLEVRRVCHNGALVRLYREVK